LIWFIYIIKHIDYEDNSVNFSKKRGLLGENPDLP